METSIAFGQTESLARERESNRARVQQIKNITPTRAWQLLQSAPDAILIDVRSTLEFLFVGHPVGAIHVPWLDGPDWEPNPDFVKQITHSVTSVRSGAALERIPLLLICRSGKRSLEAANVLLNAGFEVIYNVCTGFEGVLDQHHHRSTLNGWRFDGLPWEQC